MTTQTETQRRATPVLADARQMVSFCFYRLDPAWRRLPAATKRRQADELRGAIEAWSKKLMVLTY